MSYRISLDGPRAGYDFIVGQHGTIEDAVLQYGWQRPIKVHFSNLESLNRFMDVWEAVGSLTDIWQIVIS